ncbi:hypothetical protein PM082_004764 [Marasmius tenuissimus]|nr:hypothetical protein PM082_004764 [Marasmius tenuissimus]
MFWSECHCALGGLSERLGASGRLLNSSHSLPPPPPTSSLFKHRFWQGFGKVFLRIYSRLLAQSIPGLRPLPDQNFRVLRHLR